MIAAVANEFPPTALHASARGRFFAKVGGVDDDTSCWLWTGARKTRAGVPSYGNLCIDGRTITAHRVAYEMATGHSIPKQTEVLHRCDNPGCVRPSHLRLGTHAENMAEMAERKRATKLKGEAHGNAKMTEADARAVVAAHDAGELHADIAARLRVSVDAVSSIAYGYCWKHIERPNGIAHRSRRNNVRDAILADPSASTEEIARRSGSSHKVVLQYRRRAGLVVGSSKAAA